MERPLSARERSGSADSSKVEWEFGKAGELQTRTSPVAGTGHNDGEGRIIGNWESFVPSSPSTPAARPPSRVSKTPFMARNLGMTPQSAATKFYTPISTWEPGSDDGSPQDDFELRNLGNGKDWLNGQWQDSESDGDLPSRGRNRSGDTFLSLDTELQGIDRYRELLKKLVSRRRHMEDLLE